MGAAVEKDASKAAIHHQWSRLDGHPTHWTRDELDDVCLDFHLIKVMIEDDDPADILQEAEAFISFLNETGSLDSEGEPASVLVDHLDAIEQQLYHKRADASRYCFGNRM
ncbi:MAG: hypothetical protein HIU57_04590 [Acidobacteria bacterium]|nr:hypothetical protein [Acidobacteriota bacterium]